MMQRRSFLSALGGLTCASAVWPQTSWALSQDVEPHFFLCVIFSNGWDPSCLFDARPMAMTAANRIHNYFMKEPAVLAGKNGVNTLVTEPFQKHLTKHFDAGVFSIINGMHMDHTFDGHNQLLNVLFTNNQAGGPAFIPFLNHGDQHPELDALQMGNLFGTNFDNMQASVSGKPETFRTLVAAMAQESGVNENASSSRYLNARMKAVGAGNGRVAEGSRLMGIGHLQAKDLGVKIKSVKLPAQTTENLAESLAIASGFWSAGITRSCLLPISLNLDTHDAPSAKEQPETYDKVAEQLGRIFDLLQQTPFGNDGRSLLDVTTVMVSSEFARTMRQNDVAIDNTGTDHNPLGNAVLVGGKGIAGGQVIGASDQDTVTAQISQAHRMVDGALMKVIGKPFDFATQRPREDLPMVYAKKDYITVASVINTIYHLFDVPEASHWIIGRNEPIAPILKGLIA